MSQTRTDVQQLLARHGLSPRKRLGQHFLADRNIVDKIVRLAGDPGGVRVLEVGAGTGTLTAALAAAGFGVVSYEVDATLAPILREVLEGTDVELRIADATQIEAAPFAAGRWALVANLPYNVGTPILLDLLRHGAGIERFVVMVQREVVDRLVAGRGTKDYGMPSVVVGLYGTARREFGVPPQVFVPRPNVESAVASIDRVHAPSAERDRAVTIAAAGFGQRRKMLRSSLRSVLTKPEETLERCDIAPTARAEELSADQYLTIAKAVGELEASS